MKRSLRLLVLLLLILPVAAAAQDGEDPVMQSTRQLYEAGKGFVMGTAEQSPEEDYAYRPAESVRTLGQLLGHVADVHFLTCSIALGEQNPNTASVEQSNPGKTEMIASLRRSYEYCDRAYALSSMELGAAAELFGQPTSRFHALSLNVSHDFEHYGNMVTYVRLRGRVPPSSQQ